MVVRVPRHEEAGVGGAAEAVEVVAEAEAEVSR